MIPAGWFGLVAVVALVVPGIIFTSVRASLRGWREPDRSATARILQAVVVSVIFDTVYVAIGGPLFTPLLASSRAAIGADPRFWAVIYLAAGIVIPALIAWLLYARAPYLAGLHDYVAEFRQRHTTSTFESTPTAWDWAPAHVSGCWVRIKIGPQTWVGGKFGTSSFTSTYPEPQDIFVEEPWTLGEEGEFISPVIGGRGMWIRMKDDYVAIWVNGDQADDGAQATEDPKQEETTHA